jgi:hypothetical protein
MTFLAFFLGAIGMLLLMLGIALYRCEYREHGWTRDELKAVVWIALAVWVGIGAFIQVADLLIQLATPK